MACASVCSDSSGREGIKRASVRSDTGRSRRGLVGSWPGLAGNRAIFLCRPHRPHRPTQSGRASVRFGRKPPGFDPKLVTICPRCGRSRPSPSGRRWSASVENAKGCSALGCVLQSECGSPNDVPASARHENVEEPGPSVAHALAAKRARARTAPKSSQVLALSPMCHCSHSLRRLARARLGLRPAL